MPCNKKLYSVLNNDLPIDSPLFVTKFEIRDIYNDLVSKAIHLAIINGVQKALHSTVADPSILAGVLSNEFNYVSNSNAGHARTEGRLGSGVADIHSERTQRGAKKTERVAFFPSLANIVTCIRVTRDNEIAAGAG